MKTALLVKEKIGLVFELLSTFIAYQRYSR